MVQLFRGTPQNIATPAQGGRGNEGYQAQIERTDPGFVDVQARPVQVANLGTLIAPGIVDMGDKVGAAAMNELARNDETSMLEYTNKLEDERAQLALKRSEMRGADAGGAITMTNEFWTKAQEGLPELSLRDSSLRLKGYMQEVQRRDTTEAEKYAQGEQLKYRGSLLDASLANAVMDAQNGPMSLDEMKGRIDYYADGYQKLNGMDATTARNKAAEGILGGHVMGLINRQQFDEAEKFLESAGYMMPIDDKMQLKAALHRSINEARAINNMGAKEMASRLGQTFEDYTTSLFMTGGQPPKDMAGYEGLLSKAVETGAIDAYQGEQMQMEIQFTRAMAEELNTPEGMQKTYAERQAQVIKYIEGLPLTGEHAALGQELRQKALTALEKEETAFQQAPREATAQITERIVQEGLKEYPDMSPADQNRMRIKASNDLIMKRGYKNPDALYNNPLTQQEANGLKEMYGAAQTPAAKMQFFDYIEENYGTGYMQQIFGQIGVSTEAQLAVATHRGGGDPMTPQILLTNESRALKDFDLGGKKADDLLRDVRNKLDDSQFYSVMRGLRDSRPNEDGLNNNLKEYENAVTKLAASYVERGKSWDDAVEGAIKAIDANYKTISEQDLGHVLLPKNATDEQIDQARRGFKWAIDALGAQGEGAEWRNNANGDFVLDSPEAGVGIDSSGGILNLRVITLTFDEAVRIGKSTSMDINGAGANAFGLPEDQPNQGLGDAATIGMEEAKKIMQAHREAPAPDIDRYYQQAVINEQKERAQYAASFEEAEKAAQAQYEAYKNFDITGGGVNLSKKHQGKAEPYLNDVEQAAKDFNVPSALILSVMSTESAFNPNAVSSAGAQGLMQLMPGTAKDLGVNNPFDPKENIRGGAKYLGMLYKRYNGNIDHTLMAYNWGPGNVDAYIKTGKGAKGQGVPQEARNYGPAVKSKLAKKEG